MAYIAFTQRHISETPISDEITYWTENYFATSHEAEAKRFETLEAAQAEIEKNFAFPFLVEYKEV